MPACLNFSLSNCRQYAKYNLNIPNLKYWSLIGSHKFLSKVELIVIYCVLVPEWPFYFSVQSPNDIFVTGVNW